MLKEAGCEDHETRRSGGGLGGEEYPRLLAAPQRMRVCSLNLAQEGVELAGRYALVPRFQSGPHGPGQPVGVPAGLGR